MGVLRAGSNSRLGSYELGERLGAGGMAEVYMATRAGPHGFNKRFAIKLILPQLAQDARFVQMFCDEARICAALTHPNIVQVTDFGESEGNLFMAMEYVDGISCAKLLRAVAARGERFPLPSALFIAHEVLRALTFAHEARDEHGRPLRIVHRDVSPGNILIGRAGEVKLTDFGIVRSSFIDRRTYPGELKGKMGYMSPEQVIGGELDARSDLFTVGIVLAEMLLCRPLFPGRNELDILSRIFEADLRVLERYGSHLAPDLLATLRTALAREPNARFQTARDFAEALRGVARQAGAALDEGDLAPWLSNLGILASRSGVREAVAAPPQRSTLPAPHSTLPAPRPKLPPSGTVRAARRPLARTEPPPSSSRVVPAPPSARGTARPGTKFQIRTATGNLVGPLSLAQLFELIATGRVTRRTVVSSD
ncbi:MAG TPA: protein kinase, partial [Polyangiaceae bacterium]|nr:protein kinase [Polyangiaceae bacterium]